MFTFRDDEHLQRVIRPFFGAEKPTAPPMCPGASAPIDVEPRVARPDRRHADEGLGDAEEDVADAPVCTQVMPWRIEDTERERGANDVQGSPRKAFAVRDGRLITGQQQRSGPRAGNDRDRGARHVSAASSTPRAGRSS